MAIDRFILPKYAVTYMIHERIEINQKESAFLCGIFLPPYSPDYNQIIRIRKSGTHNRPEKKQIL
jgi:transposase